MQNVSDVIGLIRDFFDRITDDDNAFLGLGNSSAAGFAIDIDLERLADNAVISAYFDAAFHLGVSLKVNILIVFVIAS